MFKPATNLQAFMKAALFGGAGSGKTYTSSLIAIGIVKYLIEILKQKNKPVYMVDTETGSDFVIPLFKKNGIDLETWKTRAFKDLLESVKIAEENASVLLIDSQTHFWEEIQSAYKKAVGRKRILISDWGLLKEKWNQFTTLFLNSKVHIILCGRAKDILEWETADDDSKNLVKTGTTIATEKNLAYEPSLMIEMIREYIPREDKRLEGRAWDHAAYVVKDRSGILEGKKFINPGFKEIKPFFDYLNVGGEHFAVDTKSESSQIFKDEEERDYNFIRKQKAILMEEIKGVFDINIPGQGKEEKQKKAALSDKIFGTTSFIAIESLDLNVIKKGVSDLKLYFHQPTVKKEESNEREL